jgi:hypothetical protein
LPVDEFRRHVAADLGVASGAAPGTSLE